MNLQAPQASDLRNARTLEPPIEVCICSYRRPEIVKTLELVSRQGGIPPSRLSVIVADNSRNQETRAPILRAARQLPVKLQYLHAPANNISIARNACLNAASAPWVAFLDDDELPASGWLGALLAKALEGGWDAVLGPVKAVYPANVPDWLRKGDFHSSRPVWVHGQIKTAYTGNVLFRRDLVERLGLRFRPELGKSGGEDEDFFYRFADAGGRIGFAPDAVVYEHVPPARANVPWLLKRNFRAGQSHGARLKQRNKRYRDIAIASAKAAYCCGGAVLFLPSGLRRNRYLTRAALHAGVVAKLLTGRGHIELY